jgi:hypothetical protein
MATTTARKTAAKKATAPRIPAGAKKPQDHKPPEEPSDGFIHVQLHGQEWLVPEESMDDFELLDDINSLEQKGDASRMPSVLRRLLGEQWGQAMEVLRDKDTGRVSVEAGSKFVWDLLEAMNPNSSSS